MLSLWLVGICPKLEANVYLPKTTAGDRPPQGLLSWLSPVLDLEDSYIGCSMNLRPIDAPF